MVEKKVYEILTLFDTSVNVNCVISGYVCKVIVDILVKDDLIKFNDDIENIYDIIDKNDLVILEKYYENEKELWCVKSLYGSNNEQLKINGEVAIVEKALATFIDLNLIVSNVYYEIDTTSIYDLFN